MILGFKQQFPWKEPTYFREKILAGVGYGPIVSMPKIHTIRAGSRWSAGDEMHMAYGVRTKKYEQFNKGIPSLKYVWGVQDIKMNWKIVSTSKGSVRVPFFFIDGNLFTDFEALARNDGFDSWGQFCRWFTKDFEGQIIHFSDFLY